MSTLEDFLLGAPAPEEPADDPATTKVIEVKNPLPDEAYTCSKCGKTYRAIFLAKPINYDCYSCFYRRGGSERS